MPPKHVSRWRVVSMSLHPHSKGGSRSEALRRLSNPLMKSLESALRADPANLIFGVFLVRLLRKEANARASGESGYNFKNSVSERRGAFSASRVTLVEGLHSCLTEAASLSDAASFMMRLWDSWRGIRGIDPIPGLKS